MKRAVAVCDLQPPVRIVKATEERRRKFPNHWNGKPFTVAPRQVRVLDYSSQIYAARCAACGGADVELVTFAEAAKITGTSLDKIIERAAAGEFHLGIVPEALLICLDSLLSVERVAGKPEIK